VNDLNRDKKVIHEPIYFKKQSENADKEVEVLTPDSSRFWPEDSFELGKAAGESRRVFGVL
jgi:hypothetical protein